MKKLKNKLLDILLLPVRLHDGLTDRRATLIAGIVVVGAIDFLGTDVKYTMALTRELFFGKLVPDIVYNASMAVLVLLVLGLVDVICTCVPLFDISRYFKRKEAQFIANTGIKAGEQEPPVRPTAARVMKVYILSHFLIVPVSMILNYVFSLDFIDKSSPIVQNLLLVVYMLIMVWGAAVLTRGINAIFRFNVLFRRFIFLVVFTWQFIFGMVFDILIIDWLMQLFR